MAAGGAEVCSTLDTGGFEAGGGGKGVAFWGALLALKRFSGLIVWRKPRLAGLSFSDSMTGTEDVVIVGCEAAVSPGFSGVTALSFAAFSTGSGASVTVSLLLRSGGAEVAPATAPGGRTALVAAVDLGEDGGGSGFRTGSCLGGGDDERCTTPVLT